MGYPHIIGEQERPASLHAEMTILGAMLVEPDAIEDATALLKADDFAIDSHRRLYRAMVTMAAGNRAVDLVTVGEFLRTTGELDSIGGLPYMASLSEGLPRRLSIESYVRIVRDKSLMRWGMSICDRAMSRFGDNSLEAMVILAETEAEFAKAQTSGQIEQSLEEQSEIEFEALQRQSRGETSKFITSGLESLDVSHGGYAIGEMTVIAARPNVGKSPLIRQGLIANCEDGNFVHLVTPEMGHGEVLRCLWSALAKIPYYKVRQPEKMMNSDIQLISYAKKAIAQWPLKIDSGTMVTPQEVIAKARRTKKKKDTKLLIIDYLQKLHFKGRPQDRHIEVTDAMVSLTSLAKEGLAVVMVSSLTEPTGKERNRVPTIHDLRQSGDIKYEANTVLLLHRETDVETQTLSPETLLIVGKARSGKVGSRKVYFDGDMQRFVNQDQFLRGIGK